MQQLNNTLATNAFARLACRALLVGLGAGLTYVANDVASLGLEPESSVMVGAILTALANWVHASQKPEETA